MSGGAFEKAVSLVVAYADDKHRSAASDLADALSLPLNPLAENSLYLSDEHLYLKMPGFNPIAVDFSWQQWKHRRQEGKKQALIRAGNIKPGMKVLDCTAGWGRDAAIMAAFGAEVTMIERNPYMAALLKDALLRQTPSEQNQLKLKLIEIDAVRYLESLTAEEYPDLVYIGLKMPASPFRKAVALLSKQ